MSKECLTFDGAMDELARYMMAKDSIHVYETESYRFEFCLCPDEAYRTYKVTVKPKGEIRS